jgi:dihydropteroate synthase
MTGSQLFLRRKFRVRLPNRELVLGERTLVMGVLNVTPDSFSDGGLFKSAAAAAKYAIAMQRAGADIIDIGGESTRPGSSPITEDEEMRRVIPVLRALRKKLRVPISIDTRRAAVAEAAIAEGAEIVNDITALQFDSAMAEVICRRRAAVILMHMRGTPGTMQRGPFARDVITDVTRGLRDAIGRARHGGISQSRILIDPGIGFGKKYQQNFTLLANLSSLAALGYPIVIGPSRKSFIGWANKNRDLPSGETNRVFGTAAAITASILGGAHIVRVHDVPEMIQAAEIADQIALARVR